MDKYLSIITNFGCHYSCPECVVRNNHLHMTPTLEDSTDYPALAWVLFNARYNGTPYNWVSVSGGGDPLFHWWEHQKWWDNFFTSCTKEGVKTELHTSYFDSQDEKMLFFPFEKFDRAVYHVHYTKDLINIVRHGNEKVRVVFVVSPDMTEDTIRDIVKLVKTSPYIDELSFRQYVDENYQTTYYLHDFLKAGHQKDWWYIEQNDYNTYYHNGRIYTKYSDLFIKEEPHE